MQPFERAPVQLFPVSSPGATFVAGFQQEGIMNDGNNNPVYETAKETLMYRTVFWTLRVRERVG